MDKKRILIISRSFYPMRSPRSYRTSELAIYLAKHGHEVTVILPKNMKEDVLNSFKNSHNIKFKFYGPLVWRNLSDYRLPFPNGLLRKLNRLLFLLFEYPNIEIFYKLISYLKTKLEDISSFDLLISIAVPHENHWAVAKVRSPRNPIAKVWVADCGDPFMGNVLETIPPPFYFKRFENFFLKRADYVSVPTKNSIEAYNQKYHSKFRIIPQGFDFSEIELSSDIYSGSTPTFAYAGGVTRHGVRSLHNFIKVLWEIDRPFAFHVFSSGAKAVLNEFSGDSEKQVFLHDPIDRPQLLFELSKMNFLINLDNGTSLNTPSKLIDYAWCGRPILNVIPESPDKGKIEQFLNGNYEKALIVEDVEQYRIENVAASFLDLAK